MSEHLGRSRVIIDMHNVDNESINNAGKQWKRKIHASRGLTWMELRIWWSGNRFGVMWWAFLIIYSFPTHVTMSPHRQKYKSTKVLNHTREILSESTPISSKTRWELDLSPTNAQCVASKVLVGMPNTYLASKRAKRVDELVSAKNAITSDLIRTEQNASHIHMHMHNQAIITNKIDNLR